MAAPLGAPWQPGLGMVRRVVERLGDAGVDAMVFGGWAEELLGLSAPRSHGDIDLLAMEADPGSWEAFLGGVEEVQLKRLPHKRAFLVDGVLVEVLLAKSTASGTLRTRFWDQYDFTWPEMDPRSIGGLSVVGPAALAAYREAYPTLPQGHWNYDYHPYEDTVRVFVQPPGNVLRYDSQVLVTEELIDAEFVLRHYGFADRWYAINLTLDRNGQPVEYGNDGFAFNCDLVTPMLCDGPVTKDVDLFLDVLVRSDGRTARVCDEDELEDALARGWVSEKEATQARRGGQELVDLAADGRLLGMLEDCYPLRPSDARAALPLVRVPPVSDLLPRHRPSW